MFDPNVLAEMAPPDDVTVGEAISSVHNSRTWRQFRMSYPTAVVGFYYRESRRPVDPDMTMGEARRLIKEKAIIVSVDDVWDGLV